IFMFTAQYLQLVAGLSPFEAGLWTLPGAIAFVIGSNLAPLMARRVHPALIVSAGFIIAAAGIALLIPAGTDSLALVVAAWIIVSIGMGPAFALTSTLIIGSAPQERAGAASAISETGLEFGGALGLAVIGTIGTAVYRGHLAAGMPQGIPAGAAEAARDTLGGALAVAGQLPEDAGAALLGVARTAFVDGLQTVAIISTVLVVIAAGVALGLMKQSRASMEHGGHPAPEHDAPEPAIAGADRTSD
ncbi:MAG: MFS transporter, partial [SAR202 cluster bacterium]|nr:MFS transporter [SAR202 cluster bacterium]